MLSIYHDGGGKNGWNSVSLSLKKNSRGDL